MFHFLPQDILKLIIRETFPPYRVTPFFFVNKQCRDIVFEFMCHNPSWYQLAMIYISKTNRKDILQKLLQNGWDPSFKNQLPLRIACMYGNMDIVTMLLDDPRGTRGKD
jgi:hypothetical protein